jgi:hypothetical protein
MNLRDELLRRAREQSDELGTDETQTAYQMGATYAYLKSLEVAYEHGADGEDWKAKYEAAEDSRTDLREEVAVLHSRNHGYSQRIAELEAQLARFVPDVPDEGLDDDAVLDVVTKHLGMD